MHKNTNVASQIGKRLKAAYLLSNNLVVSPLVGLRYAQGRKTTFLCLAQLIHRNVDRSLIGMQESVRGVKLDGTIIMLQRFLVLLLFVSLVAFLLFLQRLKYKRTQSISSPIKTLYLL